MTTPAEPTLLDTLTDMVDGMVWQPNGPGVVALAVLGQPAIADGLRASETLARLSGRHQPVRWASGSDVVVCSCGSGAYDACPDGLILRGQA